MPFYLTNDAGLEGLNPDTDHSPPEQTPFFQVLGFRCGVDDAFVLPGHDPASTGIWYPAIRDNLY